MRKTEIKIQFIISLYLICFQFENAGKAKKGEIICCQYFGWIHPQKQSWITEYRESEIHGESSMTVAFPIVTVYSRMSKIYHLAPQGVVFPPQIRRVVHFHPDYEVFIFPKLQLPSISPTPNIFHFRLSSIVSVVMLYSPFSCFALSD